MYRDTSELARLMGAADAAGFVGFELFHVVAVTTDILFSDMPVACSKAGSSTRFSSRLPS
jgi:hypothetical protein